MLAAHVVVVIINGSEGSKRSLPDAQQRATLRDAGAFADGADDGGIEGIVQRGDRGGIAVGGQEKR